MTGQTKELFIQNILLCPCNFTRKHVPALLIRSGYSTIFLRGYDHIVILSISEESISFGLRQSRIPQDDKTKNMRNIKKVLILGSGALKIGEAGEFDYSGSQAIKALKEEGIKTVLVNPNIATIQTSEHLADKVYFLPVNKYFVEKVIKKEKPDGIFLSFGGQTALNCGIELFKSGILQKYNIEILGTPIETVILTEDRKKFSQLLHSINIPTPLSKSTTNLKDAAKIANFIGYPVMLRSGFALGGQGSGIAVNEAQLI